VSDELELKYTVEDLTGLEAWLDRELWSTGTDLAADGWRETRLSDRYFDTKDGALETAGLGARLRRSGDRTTVGLKSDIRVDDALHQRDELEAEAAYSLQPANWPRSRVRDTVETLVAGRRLYERFVLRQARKEREYRAAQGACAVSLDRVAVLYRGRSVGEFGQLEVELRDGGEDVLREVAQRLEASELVRPEPRSKMVMAAELVGARRGMQADDLFAEAGRKVLRGHLERMLEREQAMRDGDTLALKQMRVATRRMRATWRVFDGAYRPREQRRYVRQLRQVARQLGAVRDLDVLIESLPQMPELEPLTRTWRNQRGKAWRRLMRLLGSDAYRTFVKDYRRFTRSGRESVAPKFAAQRVRDLAGSRIWSAYERARSHDPLGSAQPDAAALHGLRIDAKRLRYTLETFRDVVAGQTVGELIERVIQIQDHLGELNDATVAVGELDAWLADSGADAPQSARSAVEEVRAERSSEADRLLGTFAVKWREIAGPSFGDPLADCLKSL
jgi:CHAD domain-containing protein